MHHVCLTIHMLAIIMCHIRDIAITNIPTIMGIMGVMATVITRQFDLISVTEIMAAIEAVIQLLDGIVDIAAIKEASETMVIMGMAVITAASIDKCTNYLHESGVYTSMSGGHGY